MSVIATAPPLQQDEWEFAQLLDLYRERKPARVLEIGCGQGGSLFYWLQNAAPGTTVVAIDDRHENVERYRDWLPPDVDLVVVRGSSHELATREQAALHAPYDFVFIDADHHYNAVRADWLLYGRELSAANALVAFHDISESSDPTIEVAPLWRKLRTRYQALELAVPGGFGIGVLQLGGSDG